MPENIDVGFTDIITELFMWKCKGNYNCPICASLDGAVNSMEGWMSTIMPGWHSGCDCRLVPVIEKTRINITRYNLSLLDLLRAFFNRWHTLGLSIKGHVWGYASAGNPTEEDNEPSYPGSGRYSGRIDPVDMTPRTMPDRVNTDEHFGR